MLGFLKKIFPKKVPKIDLDEAAKSEPLPENTAEVPEAVPAGT